MNGIKRFLTGCVVVLLFASAQVWSNEIGTLRKASEVKKAPFRDAVTTGALAKGESVSIQQKQGGWYRVKSGTLDGWVRMLSVRRGQARKGSMDVAELAEMASGRAGTGHVVSTTGIRGLEEEALKLARHDEAELRILDTYAVGRVEARNFAQQGGLVARPLD